MELTMVDLTREDIIQNLQIRYEKYKIFLNTNNEKDLLYTQGYCRALEQIALVFAGFTEEEIISIKKPIIGNINMFKNEEVDLDQPTYLRQQK
jgi:hypothetical protein